MKYTYLTILLIFSSLLQAGLRPADGIWGTDDDPENGSGLAFTTQNDITVVSVFTYDQAGNNAWYLGSGQVDDEGLLDLEIRRTINGTNLINNNLESADFAVPTRNLKLEFNGTQIGSMSIDGSAAKTIRAQHFGFATTFDFPNVTGQWVMGSTITNESYVLNFGDVELSQGTGGVALPYQDISYTSSHPSTNNWKLECIVFRNALSPSSCNLRSGDNDMADLSILTTDIGNQAMKLTNFEGDKQYQAFRLNKDRRLIPNDGHWRPNDDPDIGSGMVLRTQGDYTVVLVYSYHDLGQATWQIASGQFDENGKMEADLYLPNGGTSIESPLPRSAAFSEQVQTLEIQLQGTELATFSIDGSTHKSIQNSNFGVALSETVNHLVNDEPLVFPNEAGNWIFIDHTYDELKTGVITIQDESGSITPPPPGAPPAYFGSYDSDDYRLNLFFVCPRFEVSFLVENCSGRIKRTEQDNDLIIYFQDIGFAEIRIYSEAPTEPGRATQVIDLYRLMD